MQLAIGQRWAASALGQHLEVEIRRCSDEAVPAAVEESERVRVIVQAAQEAADAAAQQQYSAPQLHAVVVGNALSHSKAAECDCKAQQDRDVRVGFIPWVLLLHHEHEREEEVLEIGLVLGAAQIHEVDAPDDEAHDGADVVQTMPLALQAPQQVS